MGVIKVDAKSLDYCSCANRFASFGWNKAKGLGIWRS